MVFIWNFFISKLGGIWGIYELLPSFLISSAVIVIVSFLTRNPKELEEEFDSVRETPAEFYADVNTRE